jgi:hypothetical protein
MQFRNSYIINIRVERDYKLSIVVKRTLKIGCGNKWMGHALLPN